MDVRALKELCQRLDELATTADIIDGLSSADLHRVASAALRGALAEIKRLEADADLHQKALRDALGEIERLRSDAHRHCELRDAATDWVTKFLERKRALTGMDQRSERPDAGTFRTAYIRGRHAAAGRAGDRG